MPYTQEELQLMNSPLAYNGGIGIPYEEGTAKEVGVTLDPYGREYVYFIDEKGNRKSRRQGSAAEQTMQNMRKASDRSYQTESGRAIQQGFTEGGNTAGNAIMAAVTAPTVASAGIGALKLLASGQYAPFVAGILGSALGGAAVEEGTRAVTGKPFHDHMTDAGMWDYNAYIANPGSWAGGYYGSKFGHSITNAALSTPTTRTTVTPNGMVEVPANDIVTITETPTAVRTGGVKAPVYAAKNTNRVYSGGVSTNKGSQTYASRSGVSYQPTFKGRDNILTYTNFTGYPMPINWPGTLMPPIPVVDPSEPPVPPPAEHPVPRLVPRPTIRVKEKTFTTAPFIEWFSKQPEGTYQWYDSVPGDPHRTGIYEIRRTVKDPITVQTRVGTDPQHTNGKSVVANDSTTYEYYTNPFQVRDTGVTILPGAVAPITNIGPDTIDYRKAKNYGDYFYKKGGKMK